MIKNSAQHKWDRLAHKQLDQQFIAEIRHGLQCSPFEAAAILDTVHKVYASYFETSGTLKPGQILFPVISVEEGPQVKLVQSKQITVILTLDAGHEDLLIRRQHGTAALRRHRMQRVCIEAFQQEGLLTIEDLAYRLLNCGERTLCRDLQALKEQDIIVPLRSIIKDMGRCLSHRTQIISEWLVGKEYTEIARSTHHSITSIRNYLDKFKRVITLTQDGFDIHTVAFLAKISAPLAQLYYQEYQLATIVGHRKAELQSFLKKRPSAFNVTGSTYEHTA